MVIKTLLKQKSWWWPKTCTEYHKSLRENCLLLRIACYTSGYVSFLMNSARGDILTPCRKAQTDADIDGMGWGGEVDVTCFCVVILPCCL